VTLTTDDARPPYLQLADLLRAAIRSGQYKPGDRLPTQRELAERHNVAPMTVQSAFRVLRAEGLITAQQGRGSYVRSDVPINTPEGNDDQPTASAVLAVLERIEAALRQLEERVAVLERRAP